MTLDDARIQRFLATKEVAVLATVQPDGAPLAMAMWFLHDPATLTMISVDGRSVGLHGGEHRDFFGREESLDAGVVECHSCFLPAEA